MSRGVLSAEELTDLHRRIWEAGAGEDERGWRYHSAGVKWLLVDYGVEVRAKMGPHHRIRRDALNRLEALELIERIGGGPQQQTRSMWVAPPP